MEGPQNITRCPICSENHYWRDCQHESILQCHHLLENLFRYRMADPAVYSAPLTHTLDQIPIPILRKLVQTQAPLALVGGDDHFRSLQQWRSRSAEQSKMVPSRIGIISAASNANILEMIRNIYNFWAEREISQIQEINSPVEQNFINMVERTYQDNLRWNFSTELYRALGPVRRRLNPGSSVVHNRLTPQGLLTYIRQLESYLQQMGNNLETRLQSDAFHDYVPEIIDFNSPWLVGVPQTSGTWGEAEWLRPQSRLSNRGDTAFDREELGGEETTLPMHSELLHITDNMIAGIPDPEPPSDWNLPNFEPSTLTNFLDNTLHQDIQTRPRSALEWARSARNAAEDIDSSDSDDSFIPFGDTEDDTPQNVTQRRNRPRFPPFKLQFYDACQWNDSDVAPIADKDTLPPRPSDATTLQYSDGKCCGICWDDQTPSTSLYTHCGHSFCYDCITNMVKTMRNNQRRHHPRTSQTKMSCPMCRADVLSLTTFDSTCPIAKEKRSRLSMLLYHHPQGVQRPWPDTNSDVHNTPVHLGMNMDDPYIPVEHTTPSDYMGPSPNEGIPTGASTGISIDTPRPARVIRTSSDGDVVPNTHGSSVAAAGGEDSLLVSQFRTARDQLARDQLDQEAAETMRRYTELTDAYRQRYFTPFESQAQPPRPPSGWEHRTDPLDIRPRPSDASGVNFLNDFREAMQSAPDASGSTSDSTSTPNENSSLRRFSIAGLGEMTISRNGNAETSRLVDTLLRNPIVREIVAPLTSPNSPDAPMTPSVIDTSGNRQEVPSTPRGGTPPQIIEDEDTRASETENSPLSNMLAEQWSRRPIFIPNINEDTNPPPSFQSMAPLGLQPIDSRDTLPEDDIIIESTEDELTRANQPEASSLVVDFGENLPQMPLTNDGRIPTEILDMFRQTVNDANDAQSAELHSLLDQLNNDPHQLRGMELSDSDSDDESYSSMPPLEAIDQSSQQTPSGSGPSDQVLEDFVRRFMTRGNTIHTETGRRMPLDTEMWDRFRQSTPSQLLSMVTALNDQLNQEPLFDLPDLPLSTPESSDSDSESDSEAPTDVIVAQDNRAPRRRVARYHDLL